MPDIEPTIQWSDERVIFENWLDDGCHIFVDHKHVLTLNTPECTNDEESSCCFVENWISPDEFCANLAGCCAPSALHPPCSQRWRWNGGIIGKVR